MILVSLENTGSQLLNDTRIIQNHWVPIPFRTIFWSDEGGIKIRPLHYQVQWWRVKMAIETRPLYCSVLTILAPIASYESQLVKNGAIWCRSVGVFWSLYFTCHCIFCAHCSPYSCAHCIPYSCSWKPLENNYKPLIHKFLHKLQKIYINLYIDFFNWRRSIYIYFFIIFFMASSFS